MSGNTLAGRIGKSQNYVAVRLRDEKPFTLDDVELIADVLSNEGVERFLEDALNGQMGYVLALRTSDDSIRTPTAPAPTSDGADVLAFPPPPPPPVDLAAARQVSHRPEWEATHQWDQVGEETQVRDDEDEGGQ